MLSPTPSNLLTMTYSFRLYLTILALSFQHCLACEFGFSTSCRPSNAILNDADHGPCCQGVECNSWNFAFDSLSSRKLIGEGSMGVVQAVTHPTKNTTYVVKSFFPAPGESSAHFASAIQHEYDVSTRMQGPGFADTYALITNTQGVHMISEYLQLPLTKILRYLNEDDINCVVSMLVQALHRMHGAEFAHRDVKPDNILLTTQGHAKLIDLGESTSLNGPAKGYVGTPPYLAPEIDSLSDTGYDAAKADCWSLGVLILELYMGQLPWMASYAEDSEFANFLFDPEDYFVDLPAPIRETVQGLLEVNVARRWTITDVVRSGAFDGGTCDTDTEGRLHVRVAVA